MSMDLYVFVDHPTTLTVIEWQQAIDAAHYPVRLDERIDLRKASEMAALGASEPGIPD